MSRFPRGEMYINKGVKIGKGCRIWGKIDTKYPKVSIGNNVILGDESRILTHCPIRGVNTKKMPIKIGNNVWIGFRCIILPGTIIEDRVLIGAGSIVSDIVKSDSIYAGNPAKFIRKRDKCEIVRTYLLVTQDLVVSVPTHKPKWNITKKQLMLLFNLSEDDYTDDYEKLKDSKYCYEVLKGE